MPTMCQRTGCKNAAGNGFRKYCSDACRDSAQRAKVKLRKAVVQSTPKRRVWWYVPNRGAPPRMPSQWGVWARGYGLSSTAPSTATNAAFSESGAGLIVGADNQITDRIVAGVALNVATDKASVANGSFTQPTRISLRSMANTRSIRIGM